MARTLTSDEVTERLDAHLARVAKKRARAGRPAPQVLVRADGLEYRSGDQAQPFHAASIGKLATAAMIMQLIDARRLELHAPVASLLPASDVEGLFSGSGATVEHLLAHTSGVADYFEGRVRSGRRFIDLVTGEPERTWDAAELLAFSRERQAPVGRPGERYLYSDTGFVLLGRIVEEATGQGFGSLLREHIFVPAGMADSVLWHREPGPPSIAPLWLDGVEASAFPSLTCDWAGGGIVSTLDDLTAFVGALSDGTLISRASWAAMTAPRQRFRPGIHYGLGAMQLRFEGFMPLLRGLPRPVGHIGVLGTHAFTYPESGATVVLNFHDTREMVASFRTHIVIAQLLQRRRR